MSISSNADDEPIDKYVIDCPFCEEEEIIVDLHHDAQYRCSNCNYEFDIEVSTKPFDRDLFELFEPPAMVH